MDRTLGPARELLHRLHMLEEPARDLGRSLERPREGAPVVRPRRLDHVREGLRVLIDKVHTLLPDRAKSPAHPWILDQLLEEGC